MNPQSRSSHSSAPGNVLQSPTRIQQQIYPGEQKPLVPTFPRCVPLGQCAQEVAHRSFWVWGGHPWAKLDVRESGLHLPMSSSSWATQDVCPSFLGPSFIMD